MTGVVLALALVAFLLVVLFAGLVLAFATLREQARRLQSVETEHGARLDRQSAALVQIRQDLCP